MINICLSYLLKHIFVTGFCLLIYIIETLFALAEVCYDASVRVSFYFYNTPEDVDKIFVAMRELIDNNEI